MSQKIISGFPQYFAYTYQSGKYYGTPVTQLNELFTDINTQTDLIGDSIEVSSEESNLITIVRDGSFLHESQGYEVIGSNIIRVIPGLLDTETVEVKKLIAVSGVLETIPVEPPSAGNSGYAQTISEATVYTDGSVPSVNALPAITIANKTRITTEFLLNGGRFDVYINGSRSSINDGTWVLADSNTIEFNDDYSAVRMKVDIIKQKVG